MVRKILTAGLIAGALVTTACNTVSGMGKDVSSVGHAASKEANKEK